MSASLAGIAGEEWETQNRPPAQQKILQLVTSDRSNAVSAPPLPHTEAAAALLAGEAGQVEHPPAGPHHLLVGGHPLPAPRTLAHTTELTTTDLT